MVAREVAPSPNARTTKLRVFAANERGMRTTAAPRWPRRWPRIIRRPGPPPCTCTVPAAPVKVAGDACKENVAGMVATIITCAGAEFLAACADTALTDASATAIAKRLREPYCVGRATAFPESRSV